VTVGAWRELPLVVSVARTGVRLSVRFGMAGMLLLGASNSLQNAIAESDTRTISLHHVHTDEDITVTFKRNGRYDEAALKKLDWFLRDWRKEQDTHMDPHLIDLLWEVYHDVGGNQPIQVICGYRSPGTNAMLRERSSGVAQMSQHINGNAIDFYIPGVPLATIRAEGLKMQRGGVGFYPTSGSPFVHMDTGTIRHWPRIARDELVKIFPHGRTVHIPADGQPLPGYALALADVEKQGTVPSESSLEAARNAGVITASQETTAMAAASTTEPKRSLFASLFGKDENEHSEQPTLRQPRAPTAVASLTKPKPVAVEHIVPLPAGRPKPVEVAIALPRPRPGEQPIVMASADANFDNRGYWPSAVEKGQGLPPAITSGTSYETASATTGSGDNDALAFASASDTPLTERARPMGSRLPHMPAEASTIPNSSNTTVTLKPALALAVGGGEHTDSPWLRAAMLTPSVTGFMTANRVGEIDPRWQQTLLRKPAQSVAMSFSADPHLGLVADRFSGNAVVFLATATFAPQTTAALR